MEHKKQNINWEQRRYEIAKEMLPYCAKFVDDVVDLNKVITYSTNLAIKYSDALIEKLKEGGCAK